MNTHLEVRTQMELPRAENRRRIRALAIILLFLFVSNIFDPGGTLGLKYLAFLVAVLSSLWTLKFFYMSPRVLALGLIVFVVWPIWSLLYGAARGGDLSVGVSQVTPFLFACVLALILPAFDSRTPLRIFYACIFLLAPVVIASFAVVFLLPDSSLSQTLLEIFTQLHEREGYFGMKSMGDLEVPIVYFGSTLFLVPTFVYYLFVGRLLRAGVALLAIGLTFSKAGITIALVFGAFYSISALFSRTVLRVRERARMLLHKRLRKFLAVVVVGGVASGLLLSIPAFSDQIRDAWAGESETTLTRMGHFHSVMNLFLQNPHYLIVGQGAGIPFYSVGESDYIQSFELDHLNAIRKFGLPWFLGFSALVLLSAWKLVITPDLQMRAFGFALISMYLAAGTNPVLMTPLFIMLLTLSYFAQRAGHESTNSRLVGEL